MRDILDFITKVLPAFYMIIPWIVANLCSLITVHVIRRENRFRMHHEFSPLTLFFVIFAVAIPTGMFVKWGMASAILFLVPESPAVQFTDMVVTGLFTPFGAWGFHKALIIWGEKHNPKFAFGLKVKHHPPYKSRFAVIECDEESKLMDETQYFEKQSKDKTKP